MCVHTQAPSLSLSQTQNRNRQLNKAVGLGPPDHGGHLGLIDAGCFPKLSIEKKRAGCCFVPKGLAPATEGI